MDKSTLKNILNFLDEKEGKKHKDKDSLRWKLIFNEPLTKEDLKVRGDLDLKNTNLTSLPEGLDVLGTLYLSNSNITSLPKGLYVAGSLFIENTPLLNYTNKELIDMIKPGLIKLLIYRKRL
jgi:hypothetical protein